MRVLLVNKFYYPRGGDCNVTLATERLLKAKGHEAAVFGMRHPQNLPSAWESYFPSEVSFSAGIGAKIRATKRLFAPREVADAFGRIIDDFGPDVVHLHNIHSYLSPVVARTAGRKGVRVVWTMHDYKLICPAYTCLRSGRPCELCFRSKLPVLKHRCMKNSLAASITAWMEAMYWNRRKLEGLTDCFISPSSFLKDKMTAAGFNPERIAVLPNFTEVHAPACAPKEDYYCYVGRLSAEKGIDMLLRVASRLPYRLKIIGSGNAAGDLRRYPPQVEFVGQMSHEELLPLMQRARFCVTPSIWYENNPLSIIESLCLGTPVIGARIGGIPELISEGINGSLFEAGNETELAGKIESHFLSNLDYSAIAADAVERYSAETYYQKLIKIYHH
ncbi:MAG: glycosyltransferase [Tannerellaceae bacterium]|jgi:glycosyltransferase involved in cell wall biosynthesis|nr:glycosyltransferase [Tannerellaceae bacterium]